MVQLVRDGVACIGRNGEPGRCIVGSAGYGRNGEDLFAMSSLVELVRGVVRQERYGNVSSVVVGSGYVRQGVAG